MSLSARGGVLLLYAVPSPSCVTGCSPFLLCSTALGPSGLFMTHNLPPAPLLGSLRPLRLHVVPFSSSSSLGTRTAAAASERSRVGRAAGGVCFQLSGLKCLTDVWRISCLWTSASSVLSYSKHKQWVGRSEMCSEPGRQNRNIFLKRQVSKRRKKKRERKVFMQFIARCV